MEQTVTASDKIKIIIIGLMVISVAIGMMAFIVWLANHPIAAAILGTLTGSLVIMIIVVATIGITTWWTRQTMKDGAQIALTAQHVNDTWDAQKTKAFAQLAGTMYTHSSRALAQQDMPALPMPTQDGNWLPMLQEFSPNDVVDAEL